MRLRRAASAERFAFGQNWIEFVQHVTPQRVARAQASLVDLLHLATLEGKRLLDIGCGSGLFSLAAGRLGADVRAFDYDPQSVEAALQLRDRLDPSAPWCAERASAWRPPKCSNSCGRSGNGPLSRDEHVLDLSEEPLGAVPIHHRHAGATETLLCPRHAEVVDGLGQRR